MEIIKYRKIKDNKYLIVTDKINFSLYDDIILKYNLLSKKKLNEEELEVILKDNNLLKAYYEAIKILKQKIRTEKEIRVILVKKNYDLEVIDYAINKLIQDNYLNNEIYINTYIYKEITLGNRGKKKIFDDLIKLGFKDEEINKFLEKVEDKVFKDKIAKYINKNLKSNKRSAMEFKRKMLNDLINKGFDIDDINEYLDNLIIIEDKEMIEKLIYKVYKKYINKYDLNIVIIKINNYLYNKGYSNIKIDEYIEKLSETK